MGDQLATAIQNALLLAETERRAQRQKALNDVSARLHQTADIEEIVKIGLTAISEQLDGAAVQLQLGRSVGNGHHTHHHSQD
jgi:GAF domain-containing protein